MKATVFCSLATPPLPPHPTHRLFLNALYLRLCDPSSGTDAGSKVQLAPYLPGHFVLFCDASLSPPQTCALVPTLKVFIDPRRTPSDSRKILPAKPFHETLHI